MNKPKSNDKNNTKNTKNTRKLPLVPILGPKYKNLKNLKKGHLNYTYIGANLKSILCQNKSKLLPNFYLDVNSLNCSCKAEYIGETKKKVMTRTIEYQQDSTKGKWGSSGATEHCLKCHGQFN